MKVADAMTPIASTLRPGPIGGVAQAEPRHRRASRVRPSDRRGGRRRPHATQAQAARRAASAPAPKNAAVRSIAPAARSPPSRPAPRTAKPIAADERSSRAPAGLLRRIDRARSPARSSREQAALRDPREAAQRPPDADHGRRDDAPTAPAASDTGDTCSVSAVVPTAPTHQVRRPAIISAAVADGAGDAERAADARRARSPRRRTAAARARVVKPTARSRPTSRARCSTPSLKNSAASSSAESDEEEAEVGEVLAEVGRAARRGEPLGAHVARRTSPMRQRIDRRRAGAPRTDRARRSATRPAPARCAPTCDRRSATATARCPTSSGMNAFGVVRYRFQ